jgi:hypothetical protein
VSSFDLISGEWDHPGPKVWQFVASRDITLKEAQEKVGGYVEVLRGGLLDEDIMLVEEDGLLKQLPYNELASWAAGRDVVGDVVVMKREWLK